MAGATIDNFINKWGEDEGLKRYEEYILKLKNRPKPIHPNNKKYWTARKLIENYDKKQVIYMDAAPECFFIEFEKIWSELRDNNPKFDSSQLYSKTNKQLFTAKSQIKKEYWLQRFWSETDALDKSGTKRTEQVANEDWYIKKYGDEKGKQLWAEKCDSNNLLLNWTKKFGEENALEMFDEYKLKLSKIKSLEGYKEKYGDMAEELWEEWKKKQGRDEQWYKDRYGVKDGTERWVKIIEKRKKSSSLEGMISKYGEKEGTERYNNWYSSLSKDLNYYIGLYGVQKGHDIFNLTNNKRVLSWRESTTLKSFQEKYGEINGQQKWHKWKTFSGNYSEVSHNLFTRIIEENKLFANATFGENESVIDVQQMNISKDYIKPDFLLGKKIIEFNGSYWHRDPRKYDNSLEHEEIRNKDKIRIDTLISMGYEVLIIWEMDYEKDPFGSYDDCVNFLNN